MNSINNPFGKPFSEIKEKDLEKLKEVAEGFYVEYKSQKPKSTSIAKAIASFANSYGGLFFIGIDADKKTNLATDFTGIEDEVDIVRNAVQGNIKPFPYFDSYSIKLSNGKNVILAVVYEGKNTPYIHSNGRIYVRNGAGSDPVFEKDKYNLDRLFEKSEKQKKLINEFRKKEFSFSKAESEAPFLFININTRPFNHFIFEDFFEPLKYKKIFEHFKKNFVIKEKDNGAGIKIDGEPLIDSINTYYKSFSLRSFYSNLNFELDLNGNYKAVLPLKCTIHEKLNDEICNHFERNGIDSIEYYSFISFKSFFELIITFYIPILNLFEKI